MSRQCVQIMYRLYIDYACSISYIVYAQDIRHNLCIDYTYFFYMGNHLRTSLFTIFTYLFPPLHLALRPPFSPRLTALMQSLAAAPIGRCFLGPLWSEMRARRKSLLLLSPCYRLSSLITREHLLCCEIRTGRTLSRS